MNADQFISQNKDKWNHLAQLVDRSAGNGIHGMSSEELDALGDLYRVAISDLALAQRDFTGEPVVFYLNQLVAKAHAAIYRGRSTQAFSLLAFLLTTFPRTFRKLLPFTVVALLILAIPAIVNGVLVYGDPDVTEWTFGESEKELIPLVQQGRLWIDDKLSPDERPAASAFIMANNVQVAFTAFAGGASAGLLTVYILVLNGLSLGGLMGLCFHYEIGWRLVNFMIGHSVIELTVVFMAAGAGLRMGWAIVHPGYQTRRDALVLAAREAVILASGSIPLLFIAGTIEVFVSPLFNPLYSAIAAVLSGALMCLWLRSGGRQTGESTRRYSVQG